MFEQQKTLNEALSLVYDLADASKNNVNKNLEFLIDCLVEKVEDMIDENDKVLGDLK